MNKEIIEKAQKALNDFAYQDRHQFYCNYRYAATVTPQIKALQALIDAATMPPVQSTGLEYDVRKPDLENK